MIIPPINVQQYLYSRWDIKYDGAPVYVQYDGAKVLVYLGHPSILKPSGVWARVTVRQASTQSGIGRYPLIICRGLIMLDILSPEGVGPAQTSDIISAAHTLVSSVRMDDDITTTTPTYAAVGYDGEWYQQQLSVPYYGSWCLPRPTPATPPAQGRPWGDAYNDSYGNDR